MPEPASAPSTNPATRKIGPFPLWVWIVGVGGVALVLYRKRAAAGQPQAQLPTPIGGAVDPATGLPTDPVTGLPFNTSQPSTVNMTLTDWVAHAFKALTGAGVSPALANKALYDYAQGNSLSDPEAGAINKALGLVGMPPVTLPFFGNIPTSGGTPGGTQKPPPVPTSGGRRILPIAGPPSGRTPGERIVEVIRADKYGPNAGYYLTNFGGVYAVGGAPFIGAAYNRARSFVDIILNSSGYTLVDSTGHRYTFAPKPKPKPPTVKPLVKS